MKARIVQVPNIVSERDLHGAGSKLATDVGTLDAIEAVTASIRTNHGQSEPAMTSRPT